MSPFAYVLPLVIWLGTLIVCTLCVYVAWRAVFGDRGKDKRRCPKCWYDLAYSPSMTCAECGHTARDEREFTRTRRRPFVALSAVVICVALVIGVNDQMNQRGMLRHVPTGVLLWVLPVAGGMDGSVGREIDRRATSTKLTTLQWQRLIDRCAEGDMFSSPPSDSWIANYGRFIGNWRNRFVGDAKLEAPLLTIPPLIESKSRATWPSGMPIVVAVRLEDWWPAGMECRVRATPRVTDAKVAIAYAMKKDGKIDAGGPDSGGPDASVLGPLTFYRGAETRFRPSPFTMYLPPLAEGDHEIVIDYQIDRRRADAFVRGTGSNATSRPDASLADADDAADAEGDAGSQPWETVGTFSSTLKVRIEGTLADMAKPVSNQILDAQLAQVFGNAVRWTGGGRSPVRFGINAPATFTPEFNDIAIGVSVQLERHGEVARRLNLWWIGGDNLNQEARNYGFEIDFEDLDLLRQLEDGSIDDDGWQLRVTGDPMLALRAGGEKSGGKSGEKTPAKRYWQGDFTTPINLRMSRGAAPPRMWWTEGDAEDKVQGESR